MVSYVDPSLNSNVFANVKEATASSFIFEGQLDKNTSSIRRVLFYEKKGKCLFRHLSKNQKNANLDYSDLSAKLRNIHRISSRQVFNSKDKHHSKNPDAVYYAKSFEDSGFIDRAVFENYKTTCGSWYHMDVDDFNDFKLQEPANMLEWKSDLMKDFKIPGIEVKCELIE